MDNVHVCTLWILYTLCTLRTMPTMNTNIQKTCPVPNSRYLELLYYPSMRFFQNHASTYSIQASTPALISSYDLLILSRVAFSSTRFHFRYLAVALCSFESPQSLSNDHFFFSRVTMAPSRLHFLQSLTDDARPVPGALIIGCHSPIVPLPHIIHTSVPRYPSLIAVLLPFIFDGGFCLFFLCKGSLSVIRQVPRCYCFTNFSAAFRIFFFTPEPKENGVFR